MGRRKSGTTIVPPPPVVLPLRKMIYVSNFNTICGNSSEEDSLLDWCVTNGINSLSYYDMSSILSSSYTTFAAFYTKAKTRGITFQFTERGSQNRLIGIGASVPFNSTKAYNLANSTKTLNFGFENEFWNYTIQTIGTELHFANKESFPPIGSETDTYIDDSDTTNGKYYLWKTSAYFPLINYPDPVGNIIYRDWILAQKNIYSYAKSVGLSSEFYIGHLDDEIQNTPPESIALDLVKNTDRIHLSWYVSTAEFLSSDAGLNFVRTRLNLLGEAAYSIGKKIDICPIFAGNAPYMNVYFATNTLLQAYNRALSIYNSNPGGIITANAKLGINFKCGYTGYAIARS